MSNTQDNKSNKDIATFVTKIISYNSAKYEAKVTIADQKYKANLEFMRLKPKQASKASLHKKEELRMRRYKPAKDSDIVFEYEQNGSWRPFDEPELQEKLDDMYNPLERYKVIKRKETIRRMAVLAFGFIMCFAVGAYIILNIGLEPRVLVGGLTTVTVIILVIREYYGDYLKTKFPVKDHIVTKIGDERQKTFEEVILFYAMEGIIARLGVTDESGLVVGGEMLFRQLTDWRKSGWSADCKLELLATFPFDGTCEDASIRLRRVLSTKDVQDGVHFSHIVSGFSMRDEHEMDLNCLTVNAKCQGDEIKVPVLVRFGYPLTPPPVVRRYLLLLAPPVDVNILAPEVMIAMKLWELHQTKADQIAENLKLILKRNKFERKRLQLALRVMFAFFGVDLEALKDFLKKDKILSDEIFSKTSD